MQAIRVNEPGGPDALKLQEVPTPEPGAKEARVRLEAIGVNYIDIYHRTGLYPLTTPFTPGMEGAGVVEAVGPETDDVAVGDTVTFALSLGAYAEEVVVPSAKLVRVPKGVDTRTAAAAMLQGMTAHYLTRSTFPVAEGHRVLVHAAAGGLGGLIVQLAKRSGATVYGTVSTKAKADAARAAGADDAILYSKVDFRAEIERLTGGRGVDVVYDSVGQATYEGSLHCLARRGMLVSCGNASGPVPPIDLLTLSRGGSLFLTRPTLADYCADRGELLGRANDVFSAIQAGELEVTIDRALPLTEVAEAHRLLESRQTIGKLLLVPNTAS